FCLGGCNATFTRRLACVWHSNCRNSDVGTLRILAHVERTSLKPQRLAGGTYSNVSDEVSMNGISSSGPPSRWSTVRTYALGGLLGGLAGGAFVVIVTLALKAMMDYVSSQAVPVLIVMPLIGLALTVLVLQVYAITEAAQARGVTPQGDIARPA